MKIVLSPEAVERLEDQVRYIATNAPRAAEHLRLRVLDFLENHLAYFPRTGHRLAREDLWEAWIPGTKLVVWYQVTDDRVVIVSVWHTAQDRFRDSDS